MCVNYEKRYTHVVHINMLRWLVFMWACLSSLIAVFILKKKTFKIPNILQILKVCDVSQSPSLLLDTHGKCYVNFTISQGIFLIQFSVFGIFHCAVLNDLLVARGNLCRQACFQSVNIVTFLLVTFK